MPVLREDPPRRGRPDALQHGHRMQGATEWGNGDREGHPPQRPSCERAQGRVPNTLQSSSREPRRRASPHSGEAEERHSPPHCPA